MACNFSYYVIYLPKSIKILYKFDKVLTETACAVFLRYGVVSDNNY